MTQCPECGASLREQAKFCKNCGRPISASAKIKPSAPSDQVAHQATQPLDRPPPAPSAPQVAPLTTDVVRERDDTAPLEGAPLDFGPLPVGALIPQKEGTARYHILEVRNVGYTLNVYLVEALRPVLLCTNRECPAPENQVGETYCATCGSSLTHSPIKLRYLLKESSDPKTFEALAQLSELGLAHPGLLLFEHFQETPYGPAPRYYLLEPEPGPILAASLTPPLEEPRVLDWGRQLAEALAYLHDNQVVWHKLNGYHVAIEDRQAHWLNFATYVIPEQYRSQAAGYYLRDVRALATLLFFLCTGLGDYTLDHQLSEPVGSLFDQVLGPDGSLVTAVAFAEAIQATLEEVRRPASVRLVSSAQTDVGSVRDLNEDSLLTQESNIVHRGVSQPIGLYAVADGMGGHSAGDVASGIVVNTLAQKMASEVLVGQTHPESGSRSFDPVTWLNEAIALANTAVYEQRRQARTDMGTTLAAALMIGDVAHIGHVGDSRAYVVNDEGIRQITTDHSLVERLIATDQITREQARDHPQRNVIYRTIGDKARVEPDIASYRLNPDDCLLLCSDGLSGMVPDDDIWRIVMNYPSLPEACRQLINAANRAGGDDNIAVIIVKVEAV